MKKKTQDIAAQIAAHEARGVEVERKASELKAARAEAVLQGRPPVEVDRLRKESAALVLEAEDLATVLADLRKQLAQAEDEEKRKAQADALAGLRKLEADLYTAYEAIAKAAGPVVAAVRRADELNAALNQARRAAGVSTSSRVNPEDRVLAAALLREGILRDLVFDVQAILATDPLAACEIDARRAQERKNREAAQTQPAPAPKPRPREKSWAV